MILRETARLASGSRVLDGAVGLGQLAERLRRQGLRPVGIDASLDAVLYVRRTLALPAVLGDLTRLPFRDGVFDGVTSGETLEHLDDDADAVREIARVLETGGICVSTVPALRALWSASDDYYEHRRRYGREQFRALFRGAGLVVEKARFWGFPIVLLYDTIFLLPMNKRRAARPADRDSALQSVARAGRSRALVRVVRAIFALDHLFSWIPFGPGLLLVARKAISASARD